MKLKNKISLLLVSGVLSVVFYNCKSTTETATDDGIFHFKASHKHPDDAPVNANDTVLAVYAWQTFLALNWKSTYNGTGPKAIADSTWTYDSDSTGVGYPDVVVWETYAHRTELSPYTYPMRPFDSACKYSYKYMPQPGTDSSSFELLHNLDETSEIGSCNLVAFADSNNLNTDKYRVRYQAKVNRMEYDYIKDTFTLQTTLNSAIARTARYINKKYINPADTIKSDSILLNLPNGSIEVKTAWRLLGPKDDTSTFFTRKVITYSPQPIMPGDTTFTFTNETYALIGIHIIHKSANHPSFVFATWEHIGVQQNNMRYILIDPSDQYDTLGYMLPIRNPIPTISDLATKYVHDSLLPANSVWRNYRLVGVQGTPINDTTKPNFFLANYVIESDSLLARFHGSGFNQPFNGGNNVYYNNNLYSVGGCQGCHGGGAQHTGSDFSFIVGGSNNAPDAVLGPYPGSSSTIKSSAKLERLKRKFN